MTIRLSRSAEIRSDRKIFMLQLHLYYYSFPSPSSLGTGTKRHCTGCRHIRATSSRAVLIFRTEIRLLIQGKARLEKSLYCCVTLPYQRRPWITIRVLYILISAEKSRSTGKTEDIFVHSRCIYLVESPSRRNKCMIETWTKAQTTS